MSKRKWVHVETDGGHWWERKLGHLSLIVLHGPEWNQYTIRLQDRTGYVLTQHEVFRGQVKFMRVEAEDIARKWLEGELEGLK